MMLITKNNSEDKLNINTACLPSCPEQFSQIFPNKTGSNCWMSGWRVRRDTNTFSPRQHKEMLTLVDQDQCHQTLASSLAARDPHLAQAFSLDQSEICAGVGEGEGAGQDVCQADGGAPLVCRAQSGRWTVVGLLTWSLGCQAGPQSQHNPGVFLSIAHVMDWVISVH